MPGTGVLHMSRIQAGCGAAKGQDQQVGSTPEDYINAQLTVSRDFIAHSMQLGEEPLHALEQASQVFYERVNALPYPAEAACGPGCSYCCHLLVGTSIPEVLLVARKLNQLLPPDELASLRHELKTLAAAGNVYDEWWWKKSGASCPFLMTDNGHRCAIYPIRPFTCRSHCSSSREACRQSFARAEDMDIPTFPYLRRFIDLYSAAFILGAKAMGLPSHQVGFIGALDITLNSEDAPERWLGGEDIFGEARVGNLMSAGS